MYKYGFKHRCFLICFFALAVPFVVWIGVFNEIQEQEWCTVKTARLEEVAEELGALEREFVDRLNNWEHEFVNKGTTNGYHTEILKELMEKFVDVEQEMLCVNEKRGEFTAMSNDVRKNIERTLEAFEKHIVRLQTLDSLLMMKLQRKYSHAGLQEAFPWLRSTRPPPGKTWPSLLTKKSIQFNLVFFNNYNSKTLHQCLASVATSAAFAFLERSVQCLFVLGKPRKPRTAGDVHKTMAVIKHVRFCKKMIWRLDFENVFVNTSLSTWLFVMESIFEKRRTQGNTRVNGFFQEYKGDVLFFEEDIVLSEDVLEVAWFASLVKNTLSNIHQFSLGGGEAGENTVNAHPDTFVVRKAGRFLGNAYGFNVSTWRTFSLLRRRELWRDEEDWNIALGKMIIERNNMKSFQVVTPTLARYHVSRKNEKFPWSLATRAIDTSSASVNSGIRDVYGYLCEPSVLVPVDDVRETECPCSSRKWNVERSRQLYCAVQPFHVQDKCISGRYLDLS